VEVWLAVWSAEEPEGEKTRFMVHRHPHASPCLGSGLGLGKGGKGKGKGPVEDLASCLLMVSSPPTTTLVVVLVVRSLHTSRLEAIGTATAVQYEDEQHYGNHGQEAPPGFKDRSRWLDPL
jgi:hypothetical protein